MIPLILAGGFAVYFYVQKEKHSSAYRFLSFFYLAFVFIQTFTFLQDYFPINISVLLIPLLVGAFLTIPSTIFIYTSLSTLKDQPINYWKEYRIAGLLFLLNIISVFPLSFLEKGSTAISIFINATYVLGVGGLVVAFPVLSITYLIRSFRVIRIHQQDIGNYYSFEEGINLHWIKSFLLGFVGFFVLSVINAIYDSAVETDNLLKSISFDILTFSYLSFIGYKSVIQHKINEALRKDKKFVDKAIEDKSEVDEDEQVKFLEIWQRVNEFLLNEKKYLESSLTIYELAKEIDTNYKYLSKAINSNSELNFVGFINSFRIDHSKELLKSSEYDNYTIEAIGEMSGFKSKSAFNTAFKKFTGITPSQFKNS